LAVISHYFQERRGRASGIVFVGSSVGGVSFPLIMQVCFAHLSWAWSIRIISLIVLVLMGVANLTIKGRLQTGKQAGAISLKCF